MEYTPPPQQYVPEPVIPAKPDKPGLAIAALVLGILSLISSLCTWLFPICGLPIPIAGVILGVLGLKTSKKGMAIAGLIMAGIALLINLGLLILSAFVISSGFTQDLYQYFPPELRQYIQ